MKKILASLALIGTFAAPMTASAYVLLGTKWGSPTNGTSATVNWSLMPTGTNCFVDVNQACTTTALADFMPPGYMTPLLAAFNAWSAVAGLTFVQVADDGAAMDAATSSGDIRIGAHAIDGQNNILAWAYGPGSGIGGDMIFDPAEAWDLDFSGSGIDIFQVMAHELGHALGLDHTGVANSLMNPFYTEAFGGPQADDIAGMQYLYGLPVTNGVPEPTTLALVGVALVTLRLCRRPAAR